MRRFQIQNREAWVIFTHVPSGSTPFVKLLTAVTFRRNVATDVQVDGVSGSYCVGVGVIVDVEFGLVVVDRTTVQVSLGDVMLTFNGSEVGVYK